MNLKKLIAVLAVFALILAACDAGGGDDNAEELVVAAGAVASVDVTEVGTSGVIAEAAAPFSAAWSVSNGTAVAYVAGVPVGG